MIPPDRPSGQCTLAIPAALGDIPPVVPPDPRKPLWLYPNLLSLDAPLVAVAWLYMFARTWRVDYHPWAAYVSLALVGPSRLVTVAAPERAAADGFTALGGTNPASKSFRDSVRSSLVALAGAGDLEVPVARTFALSDALAAVELIRSGHPGGKLALVP